MKIIHIIPKDGLGGAEQAARSLNPSENLNIETVFICGESLSDKKHIKTLNKKVKLNSFSFYYSGFKYLLKEKPDILICSLWRTSLIGLSYSLFRKSFSKKDFKFIVFIHSSKFSHVFDKFTSRAAAFFANEVWLDSYATEVAFFSNRSKHKNTKIISFYVPVEDKYIIQNIHKSNNFIFWGRIAKAKRLDKAIILFNEIYLKNTESLFYIYGPDCGELKSLESLVDKLKLSRNVLFMGEKKPNFYPEEAQNSKFFINTSSHEGMAVAVVEAMQLGLIPVVTPVGEIANYCTDDFNSIYYDNKSVNKLLELMKNDELYSKISSNAQNYWDSMMSYSADFNSNCLRVLSKK